MGNGKPKTALMLSVLTVLSTIAHLCRKILVILVIGSSEKRRKRAEQFLTKDNSRSASILDLS